MTDLILDVDGVRSRWAEEVLLAVRRGGDVKAELRTKVQSVRSVFDHALECRQEYVKFLAWRVDAWLYDFVLELRDCGIAVSDATLNEVLVSEFGRVGRRLVKLESKPESRRLRWDERRLAM